MSATRLKGKPLLKINNLPIICHVVKKAKQADIGGVIVATEDKEILDDVAFYPIVTKILYSRESSQYWDLISYFK